MDIRSILVHLDVAPESIERHTLAHQLADRFDARLTVLFGHAETDQPAFAYSAAAAMRAAEAWEGPHEIASARLHAADRQHDPGAIWCDVGRDVVSALVAEAVYADLLILGQPNRLNATSSAPPGFVELSIRRSGTPALVVPHPHWQGTVGERVLIAWDGSLPAARAARSALPFLRSAAEVHIASWSSQPVLAPFSRQGLAEWLSHHGIDCEQHAQDPTGKVGDALGALATDLKADLIVMGCYGHSALRERLFGGATRSVLTALTAPVLMAH
jgi:nucleotide-binding universal stress UspA family protein